MLGNVSGGCLERDVREVALRVLDSGEAESVHYETGTEEDMLWGMGMGCEGEIDVYVQPGPRDIGFLDRILARFDIARSFAVATGLAGPDCKGAMWMIADGEVQGGEALPADIRKKLVTLADDCMASGRGALLDAEPYRFFVNGLAVPPALVLCGAGDDAMPLCRFAAETGFRVFVVDHRPAYLLADRFPGARALVEARAEEAPEKVPADENSFVVIKTRSVLHDEAWLKYFAGKPVRYIGLLGPQARREKMLEETGIERDERLYGPVGLDIGADVPEQVALSIVAELMAVATGRSPRHLREREGSIHGA
jgi:xanthine/CO dehydrogenase XdhC/CoxF family maturation factor